jgi:hypothetical protein
MKKFLIFLLLLLIPLSGFCFNSETTYDPTAHDEKYISGELYPYLYSYNVTVYRYFTDENGERQQTVEEFKEYYIRISNEGATEQDRYMFFSGMVNEVVLLHPVRKVEEGLFERAYKRWHYFYLKAIRSFLIARDSGAVLEYSRWKKIPQILKHILFLFGFDNDDLIYIGYRVETGSVNIIFHPKYSQNREYYLEKLVLLQEYFANNRFDRIIAIPDPLQKNLSK